MPQIKFLYKCHIAPSSLKPVARLARSTMRLVAEAYTSPPAGVITDTASTEETVHVRRPGEVYSAAEQFKGGWGTHAQKCYNVLMLVVAFLQWWYGPGWRDAGTRLAMRIHDTYLTFSVPILLRTLLAPWRRIVTPPGGPLDQRFRAMIDNLISRAVGFTVRLLALISATVLITLYAVIGGLLLLLWPAIPLLGPALIVGGMV